MILKMDKKPQKTSREIKEDKIKALVEKIEKAKSLTFADYHGLTASQIAQLRQKIKAAGGELLVEKNNLIKLALKKNKLPESKDKLVGPTAAILAYSDEIAPIKEIADSQKFLNSPSFKFGFFGKDPLDQAGLEQLAQIPPKNILQANVVGALASPIYGFVFMLKANLNNLVYILKEIQIQKGGES
ncbi:50S ribosomal protein L10 [Candidatus Curtissbacteria bacterium RBG_13_35_7]|uniref:Large ribosomal subunit protein uL10 n=1 Tax=Candidatus Curtissbacteria bacterium RBG_13_35_7 TaxID=1797705 RepID=A0A1F5G380_9BACT|nr:MAG: 50S ribosomal protein L10 [Candidatus Curtissbacteria bacterium RBG_13_35_7]